MNATANKTTLSAHSRKKARKSRHPVLSQKLIGAVAWDHGNRHASKRLYGPHAQLDPNVVWDESDYNAACRMANELFAAQIGAIDGTEGAIRTRIAELEHARMEASGELEAMRPEFQPIRGFEYSSDGSAKR